MSALPTFPGPLNAIGSLWPVAGVIVLLIVVLLLACFFIFVGEIIRRRRALRLQASRRT